VDIFEIITSKVTMLRQDIVEFVTHCDYFPVSIKINGDLDKEYKLIYKLLHRRGKRFRMSREYDRNLIWFNRSNW
jgi:hypothetical protein